MEPETNPQPQIQSEQNTTASQPVAPVTTTVSNDSVADHKLFAILGYILPILFFIPLVQEASKNNAFARYHANQQLNLLGVCIGVYILGRVLLSISYMLFTLVPLLNLVLLVLAIMGIIHAAQGQMKELPVIGKYNFLDKLFAR